MAIKTTDKIREIETNLSIEKKKLYVLELKQQRDDLLAACKMALRSKPLILPKGGFINAEHRDEVAALQKMYTDLEAAIAKCDT